MPPSLLPFLGMAILVVAVFCYYRWLTISQRRADERILRGESCEAAPRGIGRIVLDIAPLVLRPEFTTGITTDHPPETLRDFIQANLEEGGEFVCERGQTGIVFQFTERGPFQPRLLASWFRHAFDGGMIAIEEGATTYRIACTLNFTTIWLVALVLGAAFALFERGLGSLLLALAVPFPPLFLARFVIGRRIATALEQLEEAYGPERVDSEGT